MHHISGGHWHFISSWAVFWPSGVHLERRGRPVAGDTHRRPVTAAFLRLFPFKRAQTDTAILIKVTKRALNHI